MIEMQISSCLYSFNPVEIQSGEKLFLQNFRACLSGIKKQKN